MYIMYYISIYVMYSNYIHVHTKYTCMLCITLVYYANYIHVHVQNNTCVWRKLKKVRVLQLKWRSLPVYKSLTDKLELNIWFESPANSAKLFLLVYYIEHTTTGLVKNIK